MQNHTPLLEYQRKGLTENIFSGSLVVFKKGKVIHSVGDVKSSFYSRSLIKPFYTKSYTQELESLDWKQKAVCLSSHNGTKSHVECVKSLLPKNKQSLLKTPVSLPLVQDLKNPVFKPTKWIYNSSGHHAGILLGLINKKISAKDYCLKSHYVYKELKKTLNDFFKVKSYKIKKTAEDGDGLTTIAFNLPEIAELYAELGVRKDEDWIWQAFNKEPFFIGGDSRLDTAINQLGQGKLLAKEGADGLLAVSMDVPGGASFVIKMGHGWDTIPTRRVAALILKKFGFQLENPADPFKQKVKFNPLIASFQIP